MAWKEVRPFEWPGLSEQERIQMARKGRLTLKNLRVPESDPLWAYFQFKSSTIAAAVNTQPSASSSQSVRPSSSSAAEDKLQGGTSEAPKRGVSSREIKEKKKVKPKSDPKVEIQMKDESQRASVRPPPEIVNESRRPSDSAREVPPTRRQPAASSSRPSKPPVRQVVDKESVHPKASAGRAEKSASQESRKAVEASDSEKGPRGERNKNKERAPRKGSQEDEVMDSKSKSTLKRKRIEIMDPVENAIRRAIEDDEYPSSRLSSKRKAKEDSDYIESKPLKRRPTEDGVIDSRVTSSKRKSKEDDRYEGLKSTVSKRKEVEADGDYYEPPRQKKLKGNPSTVSSRDERQRKEYALPKKPIVESHPNERGTSEDNTLRPASTKIGKTSPPPALKRSATADPDHRHSSKSDSPMTAGSNGGRQTKSRRKSPVFTSSEDEKEEAPLNKQAPVQDSVVPPVDNASEANSMKRNKPPQTLSSNRVSLRSRYNTKYVEYLSVMQRLVVQRGKLDSMLKSTDLDSSGTITDSEGDVELLSFEELESLTMGYKKLHDELEGIKQLFDDKVKEEPTSD